MKFFNLKKPKKTFLIKSSIKKNIFFSSNIENYFFTNSTHRVLRKLTQISQTKGLKRKLDLTFGKIFSLFFSFLKFNDVIFTDLKKQLELQKHNFIANKNLFFLNVFFKNLFTLLKPTFTLSLSKKKNLKKNKKKGVKQQKYSSKLLYIFPEKRENVALK